ncbi:MAG: 16S rRNA (uracil(1498)-N(3))-methyltransferase [Candidatus Dormibacteria bacterium]
MIRVFVSPSAIEGDCLALGGEAARHVGGALRARPGEELIAVTPDGIEHLCKVESATPQSVMAIVLSSSPSRREPSRQVRLCQALLKGDQFEDILEYGSELGVTSFQPLLTERTVARPDAERLLQRQDRWSRICQQGAELAQRGKVPVVLPAGDLRQALETAAADGLNVLLLYEGTGLPSLSASMPAAGGVCLVVGPEGGWSDDEVMLAAQVGALAVTLGPRITRPLPAGLAAVTIALDRSGDLVLEEKD